MIRRNANSTSTIANPHFAIRRRISWLAGRCKLPFAAVFALSVAPALLAQTPQTNPQSPANVVEQQQIQTVAVVNGEPISRQQLANECLRRFGKEVMGSIVKKILVLNELERRGIVITERDVNEDIAAKAKSLGFTADHYINLICSQRNITPDRLKNDIHWQGLALRRLAAEEIQVSPEEIAARIEFEYGPKVQVREIVTDSNDRAQQLLIQARANPAEFGNLAKQYSINPNSQAVKGLLPPIAKHSGDERIESMIFSMQPGEISDVINVDGNQFIILKCERIFPGSELSAEESVRIQDRIAKDVSEQKLAGAAAALFDRLEKTAQITNVMNDAELSQKMPGVAAVVDNRQISIQMLSEECIARYSDVMLETEIDRTLLTQSLQERNMQVTQDDLSAEINRAAESFGYVKPDGQVDVDAWLKYVTDNDTSKVDFYIEDEVWRSAALRKIVDKGVTVTDEDLRKGFEASFGPRVEVLAIVLSDNRQAMQVWKMASQNPTAEFFGKLANQYSVEPASQSNFGEVPPIPRHSTTPELEKEAFSLKVGEISQVVQVGEYYFILMGMGQTTPMVEDIDSVREILEKDLYQKKLMLAMQEMYQSLREDSQIDNFLAGTSQPSRAQREAVRKTQSLSR